MKRLFEPDVLVFTIVMGSACSGTGVIEVSRVNHEERTTVHEVDVRRQELKPARGVTVVGAELRLDGRPLRIRGVSRSGSEYACIQGFGFFDGPSDDASVKAIAAWKANAVRIPLNEDCWLAINGAPSSYSGDAYKRAIVGYVGTLEKNGLVPILELHWTAAGSRRADRQDPMPNRDHSVSFWLDVATTFKGHPTVMLEPFNEPFPDSKRNSDAAWKCWRDGGTCPGMEFRAAGMQELVDAIRSTGSTQVILLGGVDYANSLSKWLEYAPNDPSGQLGASWHVYNFNACNHRGCYERDAARVAMKVPLVATEIGQDQCGDGRFIEDLMGWLDERKQSYLGWTWDAWKGVCPALITDYAGSPNGGYGQTFKDHLMRLWRDEPH